MQKKILLNVVLLSVISSCASFVKEFNLPHEEGACSERQAYCPFDPMLKPKNEFCEIDYHRNVGPYSECGPKSPGQICQIKSCQNQKTIKTPTFFDSFQICQAMQFINHGINESPNGTWNKGANMSLSNQLNLTVTTGVTAKGGVRYYHFADARFQWFVFLGSKTLTNWLYDLKFRLVEVPLLAMSIHNGFLQATTSEYDVLKKLFELHAGKDTYITGHSLGGAVASIFTLMLTKEGYKVTSLLTFGQPEVTNDAGVEVFNNQFASKINLLRLINENDGVPFFYSSLNKEYAHFGPELRIENDEGNSSKITFSILPEPDGESIISASENSKRTQDHPPKAYIGSLNQLFCNID